jgi:hypothetical protein
VWCRSLPRNTHLEYLISLLGYHATQECLHWHTVIGVAPTYACGVYQLQICFHGKPDCETSTYDQGCAKAIHIYNIHV